MFRPTALAAASIALVLIHDAPLPVASHGYLKTPRSRNYRANQDGVWWPVTDTNPAPESEPQSANIGGTDAQCGIIAGQRNYDYPQNAGGGPIVFSEQACYQPGSVIDVDVVLTAHHLVSEHRIQFNDQRCAFLIRRRHRACCAMA